MTIKEIVENWFKHEETQTVYSNEIELNVLIKELESKCILKEDVEEIIKHFKSRCQAELDNNPSAKNEVQQILDNFKKDMEKEALEYERKILEMLNSPQSDTMDSYSLDNVPPEVVTEGKTADNNDNRDGRPKGKGDKVSSPTSEGLSEDNIQKEQGSSRKRMGDSAILSSNTREDKT